MSIRFIMGWMGLILFSLLLFFFLQIYFFFIHKISLLVSSFFSFLITIFIVFFITRWFAQPLDELIRKVLQLIKTHFGKTIEIKSYRDIHTLSKAIEQIEIQMERMAKEISKEEEYLKAILKEMVEGILVVDEKGKIVLANEALKKLFSLPSDISNRTPLEIIRNVQLEEAIRKVLQEGINLSFELHLPKPLGKTFDVNVVKIPSSEINTDLKTRSFCGVIAVFHDISRLKELEKIRQDFVANVSHELRTPLTTIKGYTETLLEGGLKDEIALQFIQIIKKNSDRLEKIVEDLLMLSKIEAKEFQWNMEILSVSDLIGGVLEFLRDSFKKKNITVSINEISPLLKVYGDRQYLEQVLLNLLDNSIKYGREGGRIMISARKIDQGEVEISVKDNGIGIPKEDIQRIFERFYRVDKGRSRELGGTGLGLSIVKHIVQAHGGRVWVESILGEGSTFFFTLPLVN